MGKRKTRTSGRKNRASVDVPDAASVPPTPERGQHAEHGIEVAEPERTARGGGKAFTDSEGRPSRPWRVIDTLAVMERMGSITADERDAGERYRAAYERAGRAGVGAPPLLRSGGGHGDGGIQTRVEAGRKVAQVERILRAPSATYAALREILGEGMSCGARDAMLAQRKGTSAELLRKALRVLAAEWTGGGLRRRGDRGSISA